MKLEDKGRFQSRPPLDGASERVARAVEQWDAVHARTHWQLGDEAIVDGADFYVGEHELGHLHLEAEAHIAVPAAIRAALVAARLARPFRWSGAFVVVRVRTDAEAEHAAWVFALAYDHLRGATETSLLERIRSRAQAA